MSAIYSYEQREVRRTGMASLGWLFGHGFIQERLTVKKRVWCVTKRGSVIAECRNEGVAIKLSRLLNDEANKISHR